MLRQILAVAVALAALLGGAAPAAAQAGPQAQPNIVFLMLDDLDVAAWSDALKSGFLPNTRREVISKGTTFDEAFVSLPWCCPSRATALTGQFPHNHGVIRNDGQQGGFAHFDDRSTLATWLRGAGYRTGLVGKYLNGYLDATYVPPGWETWRALHRNTYCMYQYGVSMDGTGSRAYGSTPADYQTDVLATHADEFLRAADDRPFFLMLTPTAPHTETCVGDGYDIRPAPRHIDNVTLPLRAAGLKSFNEADMSDKPAWMQAKPLAELAVEERLYDNKVSSLRAVDDMVGRLTRTLRETGKFDNTLFIVTSDNGFQYGTHRMVSKVNFYEESIRIPMVIRAPGQATRRQVSEWVMNNDWAPTIVDYAAAPAGLEMDGRSLAPLVRGELGAAGRRTLLVELPSDRRANAGFPPYYMVRSKDPALTGDGRTLVYAETYDSRTLALTDREFYDLQTDRLQNRSLHDSPLADRVAQREALKARMLQLVPCRGAGCRALED